MKWIKQGHIYTSPGTQPYSKSHAQVPFAFKTDEDRLRIFFATRDERSRSSVGYIDVNPAQPSQILGEYTQPCFQHGASGYFDDSGTMPSWFLEVDGALWLYYTAWNRSQEASYRLSIGLAVSHDLGKTFERMFQGPILDRGPYDPIWVGQPCVIRERNRWKMWYLSCQKIEYINNHPEPFYNVKYAESEDGIHWHRTEDVCIDFSETVDAIGRPCVWQEDGKYYMLHSNRQALGYRDNPEHSYRIQASSSTDGIRWSPVTDFYGLERSNEGWDSVMNEYCTTYVHEGTRYLIYNGNGFGASGFGYAVLEK
ncbi:MAG: hypothetical protein AAFQ98_08700 [Bacteroidota bacterium]